MSTPGQSAQAEPSLRDALDSAFDAVESVDAATEPSTAPAALPAPSSTSGEAAASDAPAGEAPAAAPSPSAPATAPAAASTAPQLSDGPKMPPGFPGGDQAWAAVPAEHKTWLKNREVQVERYIRQNAEASKFGQQMWGAVRPYEAMIKAQGAHPAQVVEGALMQHYRLATGSPAQRAQVIADLAQQYGVDFNEVATQAYQPPQQLPPEVAQLREVVGGLVNYLRNNEMQQTQAQLRMAEEAVTGFQADPQYELVKDPALREAMAVQLDSGAARDLKHAYELAVWNVPHIRKTLLEKQLAEQSNAARNARTTAPVRGGAPVAAVMEPNDESLRGSLERAFASHAG